MNPLPMLKASLYHNRTATVLFVMLIAFAVGLGVAIAAQERALRQGTAHAADAFDLLVGAPGSPTGLLLNTIFLEPGSVELMPGDVWRKLIDEPRTLMAAPIAFGDSYDGMAVVGTTAEFVRYLAERQENTRIDGKIFDDMTSAVIGADVDLNIADHFEPAHGHGPAAEEDAHEGHAFRVVGRLPHTGTPWDRALIIAIEAVWATHGLSTGHLSDQPLIGPPYDSEALPGVPVVVIRPDSLAAAYGLRNKYRTAETMAFFPAEVLVELYAILGDARAVMSAMAVASQALVVLAVLAAVMTLMSLFARHFAVLRAIGAPRVYVFAVVWSYVSLIVAGGAALGLCLGWGMSHLVSRVFEGETGIALSAQIGSYELTLAGIVAGLGFVLATLPALALYRRPVVETLSGRAG